MNIGRVGGVDTTHPAKDKTMRAVIYARVSTSEQTKGYSLPSQIEGCREYALRHGLDVIAAIQDNISGTTRLNERVGGKELLHTISNGHQAEAVIVWRLDRLSRPPEGEYSRLLTTIETLGRLGVAVHDCESGEIKNSMESIMIAFFKGLAASKEREAIIERSMRGKMRKAREGKWVGGGFASYGYRKIGKKRDTYLEIDEIESAIVRRIFDLFIGKFGKPMSIQEIAAMLTKEGIPTPGRGTGQAKRWYPATVTKHILKNRQYIGELSFKGIVNHFPELSIIDRQTWEAAQKQIKLNKHRGKRKRPGPRFLMSSHLKCTCGFSLTGFSSQSSKGVVYRYYRCSQRSHYGKGASCKEKSVNANEVDIKSWDWLVNVIGNDARLDKVITEIAENAESELESTKQELEIVNQHIIKVERKMGRLMTGFGDEDNLTIAAALKNEIENTAQLKDSLERQQDTLLAEIANSEITPQQREEIKAIARRVRSKLEKGGNDDDKRALIEALDVQAKLIHKDNGRRIKITCGLGGNVGAFCIDNTSHLQSDGQNVYPAA